MAEPPRPPRQVRWSPLDAADMWEGLSDAERRYYFASMRNALRGSRATECEDWLATLPRGSDLPDAYHALFEEWPTDTRASAQGKPTGSADAPGPQHEVRHRGSRAAGEARTAVLADVAATHKDLRRGERDRLAWFQTLPNKNHFLQAYVNTYGETPSTTLNRAALEAIGSTGPRRNPKVKLGDEPPEGLTVNRFSKMAPDEQDELIAQLAYRLAGENGERWRKWLSRRRAIHALYEATKSPIQREQEMLEAAQHSAAVDEAVDRYFARLTLPGRRAAYEALEVETDYVRAAFTAKHGPIERYDPAAGALRTEGPRLPAQSADIDKALCYAVKEEHKSRLADHDFERIWADDDKAPLLTDLLEELSQDEKSWRAYTSKRPIAAEWLKRRLKMENSRARPLKDGGELEIGHLYCQRRENLSSFLWKIWSLDLGRAFSNRVELTYALENLGDYSFRAQPPVARRVLAAVLCEAVVHPAGHLARRLVKDGPEGCRRLLRGDMMKVAEANKLSRLDTATVKKLITLLKSYQ